MYTTPLGTPTPLINFPTVFPTQRKRNLLFSLKPTKRVQLNCYPRVFLPKASSNSNSSANSGAGDEDFVTRVLRENPSQIEPKYLIGDKLYTLKEKESLSRKGFNEGIWGIMNKLNLKALVSGSAKESGSESNYAKPETEVYLKDLLREYKGKLYVPEQVFVSNLSEEDEFDKNVKELPKMNYEDFRKYMESDKVKLVTFKEDGGVPYGDSVYRDFVVDLKDIPGETSLHKTKWSVEYINVCCCFVFDHLLDFS